MPLAASRLSGGVVITTYAAATPAVARRTFATVRAAGPVIYELRGLPEPGVDPPDEPPRLPNDVEPAPLAAGELGLLLVDSRT